MESVEGKVKRIAQRPDSYGVMLEEHEGKWFNGKNQCVAKEGDNVNITYTMNAKGYKDIQNMTKTGLGGSVGEKPPEKPPQDAGFDTADKLSVEDRVIGTQAYIYNKCYKEIKDVIGKNVETDGEYAAVATLYISTQKHITQGVMLEIAKKIKSTEEA